jgi:alginate O-acetyltransferase complex protein AlgI
MIFTTYWFLVFAAIVVAVYWLLPLSKLRHGWLGLACLIFHAHFAGPAGMAPIIVLMVITYVAGYSRNRGACITAMVICGLTLCFYKYAFFLIGAALQPLSPELAEKLSETTRSVMPGAPPLGISFFAFEFVHYLFEIKKGGEPIRNPLKFLLFSIFFPSLVAGPIKRYPQFLATLQEGSQRFRAENISAGLRRIALGYFKKVAIADNLTTLIEQAQPNFATLDVFSRWLLLFGLAFRILMDFSGYSDIAIGLARLLGLQLPENFDWPYAARNLQEFWQRWHISLSSWIRDYIYIPLGGNRLGPTRRVVNGLIAFALCGLWHGPAWNFVVWGVYHGVGLVLCASYAAVPFMGSAIATVFRKEPLLGLVLTQLHVFLGWLLFFYPLPDALHMAKLLFSV